MYVYRYAYLCMYTYMKKTSSNFVYAWHVYIHTYMRLSERQRERERESERASECESKNESEGS